MARNIHNIEDYMKHRVDELICINCKKRWVAVWPAATLLMEIECPGCHMTGYTITTGETRSNYFEGDEWEED